MFFMISRRLQSLLQRAAGAMLLLSSALCVALSGPAEAAEVQVENAWVRATVPGQKATGAFMRLTAPTAMRLVSVQTPAAAFAEVHEMRLENNVMKMSALKDGLELPAGKPVELKPGSFHLMLLDLAQPLKAGSSVPLTLVFRQAGGEEVRQQLTLPVNAMAPMPALAPASAMSPALHQH